jgi:enoyl-CoA hydratase
MSTPGLFSETRDGVCLIAFDRPASANAVSIAMHAGLVAMLAAAANDANIGGVVLATRHPRIFSAGADLKELADLPRAQLSAMRRDALVTTLDAMLDFSKPLVCAVQGKAIGAGWMLALVADEIVAGPSAAFSLPEIRHGMPTPIGVSLLESRVGRGRVHAFVQTARVLEAQDALLSGLLDHLVGESAVLNAANERIRALASFPAAAYAVNKRFINRTLRSELARAAQAE